MAKLARWKLAEVDINVLYRRFADGDSALKSELFRALDARFRLFVRRRVRNTEDGDEMVQNALMTIAGELDKNESIANFAAWAYKVLDFRIKAHLKDRSRNQQRAVSIENGTFGERLRSQNADPDFKRMLLHCLGKLRDVNNRYARILNYKVQGYTSTEICKRLQITHTNMYSILSRARSMLLKCLKNGDIGDA